MTIELRKLGHEAYSCDLMDCSGGHPEWHLQCDALQMLKMRWDMIIAFPPCTYLSNAGARFLYPQGKLNKERLAKGLAAKEFFMKFYNADCPKIAIENPVASSIYGLPKHSQDIQPYMFGHPYKKKTRLWLKGLPNLIPTDYINISESTKIAGNWFNRGGEGQAKEQSQNFLGRGKSNGNTVDRG